MTTLEPVTLTPGAAQPRSETRSHRSPVLVSNKVQARHLDRMAVVYVRQSSARQVVENRESTLLQYGLRERAVALGWPQTRVLVIDDDLGQSGQSVAGRPGFQRLLAEVGLDHVGIILGIEMSRLARSCRDWHQLLELCAVFGTLIGDADGVFDPCEYNDRLLLGLKGYIQLGVLPAEKLLIDIIPVDYAAKAVFHLSRQEQSMGKYFHLWNLNSVPMEHAYEWIKSFGYDLDVLPFDTVRKRVLNVDASNPLYPFIPLYRREARERNTLSVFDPKVAETVDVRLECANTLKGLEGSGIQCPPVSEDLARLCLSYLVETGFLPPPIVTGVRM